MDLKGRDFRILPQPSKNVGVAVSGNSAEKETVGNVNPLEIPEIVAIVTGYINHVEDLKCVRGLNTMWRDEVFQKWRNTAVFLINYETIPVLLKAFGGSEGLAELTESQKEETLARKDPFRLLQFPFRKYRFAKSQRWMYPLDKGDEGESERKLIWEKCINPNATYLDVGEPIFVSWGGDYSSQSCLPGLRWILCHASNVTDFAMAPLLMEYKTINPDNDKPLVFGEERPIWFLNTFQALRVDTLTISKTQAKSGFHSFGNSQGSEVLARIFCMLPNLKTVNLQKDNEDRMAIINGLGDATKRDERFRLQSFNAPLFHEHGTWWNSSPEDFFTDCSECKNPSLRELKLAVSFEDGVKDYNIEDYPSWPPFHLVRETLTKLEFQVDCDDYPEKDIPEKPSFYFGDCIFPNLTHFKVQLQYKKFHGKSFIFDLNNLKKMPMLREFHFGNSRCVEKGWVTRKLGPVENNTKAEKWTIDNYEMPHLKSFHFHGNFKKEALHQLGRIAGKLESMELILDQENCFGVKDIWPRLKNLKLLPCSDVPTEYLSNLKDSIKSLNVVDESNNWIPAKVVEKSDEAESSDEWDGSPSLFQTLWMEQFPAEMLDDPWDF